MRLARALCGISKYPPKIDKAETIANILGDSFLRIAKGLRDLQDNHPELFLKAAELAGISRRKAFALTRMVRQFEGIPEATGRNRSYAGPPGTAVCQSVVAW